MAGAAQAGRPLAAAAAPARTQVRRRERCPECGIPAQRRQLVCLGCGERLALEHKQPRGARPAVMAAAALALVSGTASIFVVSALMGGRGGESSIAQRGAGPAEAAPAPQRSPAHSPALARARADRAQRAAQERGRRQVIAAAGGWPAAKSGWTVVLLGAGDPGSAERFAASLESSGIEAGVISPEQHPELGALWLVYSGTHAGQAEANAAASELRAAHPGAFSRYIEAATGPAKATSSTPPAQPPPG